MDVVYFILLIGPLVFAHELGHFVVAKIFGIGVMKFSLGFGPVMFGRQAGETYYQIAWIPLGGFVRFIGDEPGQEVDEKDRQRSFLAAARWKRALVVFAGPLMSLVLPVFCYFAVGLTVDELRAPTVGQVIPGTPAEAAGLQAGDRIRRIDDLEVFGFIDLQREISKRPNEKLRVVVERDEEQVTVDLTPALVKRNRNRVLDIWESVGQIGIHNVFPAPVIGISDDESPAAQAGLQSFDVLTKVEGQPVRRWIDAERILTKVNAGDSLDVAHLRPQLSGWAFADVYVLQPMTTTVPPPGSPPAASPPGSPPAEAEQGANVGIELASLYIAHVVDGMPAHEAGLRGGDKILTMDGEPIRLWEQFLDRLNKAYREPHDLVVLREGERVSATLHLEGRTYSDRYAGEIQDYRPGMGVYRVGVLDTPVPNNDRLGRAAREAVHETLSMIRFMALGFLRMVQGRISLQSIGGPIMLFEIAGTAGRAGAGSFLQVLALISVNLGLINLLPIPVLDGGHLLLLGVEAIRRRNLSQRARELVNIGGLFLLVLLMVFALKNDIQRYWDWDDFIGLFR
jgi:regulator of sigma E protease